ncbi:condensation domain-containing protein [Nocardia terpenica]|uniref:Condensation protein n=1 Tax=Nocardia terpenica TaxID=455432 RepID=A0A291RJA5_9NOCA|nr:condensation domain-containing protein [Nocardia terpenica]ATL67683.1 condensation protein [Nocardia terpenica]
MRLLFLDQLAPEPGTLVEWSVSARPGPTPDPTPPTSNQIIHLSGTGPTTWLAATFDVAGPIDEAALQAAFAAWLPRHDALHCCFGAGPTVNLVSDSDIRLERRRPVHAATPGELRDLLGARLDAACAPFTFPPYFLGAVSRAETSTVICGFDHAVCDAWSITVAVTELDELYRAAHEDGPAGAVTALERLPEASSFLAYSTREAAVPAVTTDPLLREWREFLSAAGNDLPHFPMDLGVPPGELAPPGSDVRTVLGPGATAGLHRATRAGGHSIFAVLLAAVAQATAKLDGSDHTDLVFPVHTRREPRHHNTFGWLVSNAPARIQVGPDLAATIPGAAQAIRSGQRLAQVPATRVLAALDGELRRERHGLFSVSYADYRQLPGGSRSELGLSLPRNATHISRTAPLDDVQLWFARTDDGLALRTRYPDTQTARAVVAEFLGVVTDLVQTAAQG